MRRRVISPGSEPFANHMAGHFAAEAGDWQKAINIGLDMWEAAGTMVPDRSHGPVMVAEPDLVIWEGFDAWRRSGEWDPEAAYSLARSIFDELASAGDPTVAIIGPRALTFLRDAGADPQTIAEAEEAIYLPLSRLPVEELPYAAQDLIYEMRERAEGGSSQDP